MIFGHSLPLAVLAGKAPERNKSEDLPMLLRIYSPRVNGPKSKFSICAFAFALTGFRHLFAVVCCISVELF